MNKKILAICDSEEKYLYKLQEILEERDSFPFEVAIYTDIDALNKSINHGRVDVLLISDTLVDRIDIDKANQTFTLLVVLLDSGSGIRSPGPGIFKYQSGEMLRKDILRVYSEYISENEDNRPFGGSTLISRSRDTMLIGIFSPIGRCLQTSFAVLLGKQLSKDGPTLYLNFEPFAGLSKTLGCENDKDLTDLVYYLRNGSDRLIYKLESMVCRLGSLDYIAPATSFVDLCMVEEADWLTLINTLKRESNYKYIILDLSEMVTGLLSVLRQCQLIYTITRIDSRAKAKIEQYEGLLRDMEYDDIIDKTKKKEFPIFKNLPDDIQNLEYSELAVYIQKIVEDDFDHGV